MYMLGENRNRGHYVNYRDSKLTRLLKVKSNFQLEILPNIKLFPF